MLWSEPLEILAEQSALKRYPTEQRLALIKAVENGELGELEFEAVVFRDGPNRNHLRFRQEDLVGFAGSYAGQPFLRNHDLTDIGSRDGTVTASRLERDGFVQTIKLTTKRGLLSYLEGQIDRFSIGWYSKGATCSVCGNDWRAYECTHFPGRSYIKEGRAVLCELIFVEPKGKETSAVNAPAVEGTGLLAQLSALKGEHLVNEDQVLDGLQTNAAQNPSPAAQTPTQAPTASGSSGDNAPALATVSAWTRQIQQQGIDTMILQSGLSLDGQESIRRLLSRYPDSANISPDVLGKLIEDTRYYEAKLAARSTIRGVNPITAGDMKTDRDKLQASINWILGDTEAPAPPPNLRSLRDAYLYISGDHNFYGVMQPEAQLAAADSTTLPGMVVNAMNRIFAQYYARLSAYRWYEHIVKVQPNDGTSQPMQWVTFGGIGDLPIVAEGAPYTEANVTDAKESGAFAKRGKYVGITLEMIRKNNIAQVQMIPQELINAAIRTRSNLIAGLFTQNNNTGPTLAQDSTALFHLNHGNLRTTAYSLSEWTAVRSAMFKQIVPGSGKRFGLWPRFALVPIDLYDVALETFGWGSGNDYIGKPNSAGTAQAANPFGQDRMEDPRPIPIVVPEWTDTNDWAAIADPTLHPVVQMSYMQQLNGNAHPLPEVFTATDPNSGLLFTSDVLPVKIRDWYSYGISTYIGIHKSNV